MTTTSDLTAQRAAGARAFVKQELKKGRAWSSLTYEYDREQTIDSPNGQKEREHDHAELNDRMDRPHI